MKEIQMAINLLIVHVKGTKKTVVSLYSKLIMVKGQNVALNLMLSLNMPAISML